MDLASPSPFDLFCTILALAILLTVAIQSSSSVGHGDARVEWEHPS